MSKSVQKLLDERVQGKVGLEIAFVTLESELNEDRIAKFLEKVPETGQDPWMRFRTWQHQNDGKCFTDFVIDTINA
jgi:hypothetical protein